MPSWGIHLKLAKNINKKLNLDKDLFMFGNIIPDVDKFTLYNRLQSHYYTGINFSICPMEKKIDLSAFFKDYQDKLKNPLIIGYFCHLLTDNFYNEYIYKNKWVQKNNKVIGIKTHDGNIIDIHDNFYDSIKYKRADLELYAKYIYHEEKLDIPIDELKIINNINLLKDNFYTKDDVIRRIDYLNNGKFKKFNEFNEEELKIKDNYLLFTKEELDNLFNNCYEFILKELKKVGIINE